MQYINLALELANTAAKNIPWDAVIASGFLSPLLLGIKKWFSVQSERTMIVLVLFVATLTAAAEYLLTVPTNSPGVIAMRGAVLAFMTQPVYFFIVKPIYRWFSARLAEAARLKLGNLLDNSPAPTTGIPAPVTPPNPRIIDDFRL